LVVTVPCERFGMQWDGGFESLPLTPWNANQQADSINGFDKEIFWQFLDEQPDKIGPAVRHFVDQLDYDSEGKAVGTWEKCEAFLLEKTANHAPKGNGIKI